ncbi:MAG: hypothetical protein IPL70_00010 [Uliginosibacterium sp.]|nr:hypothetical protein [Uliginosibacterium sp.]
MIAALAVLPLVGSVADWMVENRNNANDGMRQFQWTDSDEQEPGCVGAACGMATVPLRTSRQVGGAAGTLVTARIRWPAPVVIEARSGTYLEVVDAIDAQHPVVQHPFDAQTEDGTADDTRPVLLANEVQDNGTRRPVMVPDEGFVSAWAQHGDSAGQFTAWAKSAGPNRNGNNQEAEITQSSQWRALRMRSVQFQPMPPVIEVDILRAALLDPIRVGHAMVFDWRKDGALQTIQTQLVPSRSMVGVITQVQEAGKYLNIKVQIPRTSPYGAGHWLWHRLDGLASGEPLLPNHVQAMFFPPGDMLGTTSDWGLLEHAFRNLPVGEVMRAPVTALDPTC